MLSKRVRDTRALSWSRVLLAGVLLSIAPAVAWADEQKNDNNEAANAVTEEKTNEKKAAGAAVSPAQEDMSTDVLGGFRLSGDVAFGFHFVSTNGHVPKYREDIDLEDGPFLGRSRLVMVPGGSNPVGWVDRIVLEGHGYGSHPNGSWGISAQKSGAYKFRVRGRTLDYFNQITGSPLAWDLTRENTEGELSVVASENLTLYATFRRFQTSRFRTAARDISREEFQFDEPLDQEGNTWGFGGRWRVGATAIFMDQQFSQFKDNAFFSEDTLNQGLAPDEAFITFLEDRQVRSIDAPITRAGVTTTIADRLRFTADILASNQDLGFSWVRRWDGANFQERPVSVSATASGQARREVRHYNGRLLYTLSDQVQLSARYRHRGWSQRGEQSFAETTVFTAEGGFSDGFDRFEPNWSVTLDQFLFGVEANPSDHVLLFGELGLTGRDQEFPEEDGTPHASTTDTTSFRLGTRIRPSARFDIEGSYTRDDVDDPFTRVAPTSSNRIVGKVRFRPGNGWSLTGSITRRDADNDLTPAALETTSYGVTLAYNAGPERWLSAGYNRVKLDREVVTTWRPFFGGSATDTFSLDLADATLMFVGEYLLSETVPLTLYGRVSYVDSASVLPVGTVFGGLGLRLRPTADHDVDVLDVTFGGRYLLGNGLFLDLGYRYVDYEETNSLASSDDDYTGNVVTFGFGFRF